jgi:hypothetical protein
MEIIFYMYVPVLLLFAVLVASHYSAECIVVH